MSSWWYCRWDSALLRGDWLTQRRIQSAPTWSAQVFHRIGVASRGSVSEGHLTASAGQDRTEQPDRGAIQRLGKVPLALDPKRPGHPGDLLGLEREIHIPDRSVVAGNGTGSRP